MPTRQRLFIVFATLVAALISALILAGAFAQAQQVVRVSIPAPWAALPQDADQIVAPGDRDVPVRFGFSFSIAAGAGRHLRNWCAYSAPREPDPPADVGDPAACSYPIAGGDSFLQLRGPAAWADGSRRLIVGEGSDYPDLACTPGEAGAEPADAVVTCYVSGAEGVPAFSVDAGAEDDVRIIGNVAAAGEDAAFWARYELVDADGNASVGFSELDTGAAGSVFGEKKFTVREVRQVETVSLAFAADDQPTDVGAGAKVALVLSVLNEDGIAADPAEAISSIVLRATRGEIAATGFCQGGPICTFDLAELREEAKKRPDLLKALDVELTASRTVGGLAVTAQVVSGARIVRSPRLALNVSGAAAQLRIAPVGSLLNRDTPDAGSDKDDLDAAQAEVTSTDASGAAAALPIDAHIASITGPDGPVRAGAIIASIRCPDEARLKCLLALDVDSRTALAAGTYAATLAAGAARGDAVFSLAGAPDSLRIRESGSRQLGGTVQLEIDVVDAAGVRVADGTPVSVAARSRTGAAVLRVVSPPQGAGRVADGVFRAEFVVVSEDVAIVTVSAGDVELGRPATAIHLVDARPSMQAIGCSPTGLSNASAGSFAIWVGAPGCAISELIRQLPHVSVIQVWNGLEWLGYAIDAEGNAVPGSRQFVLAPNDVIWLRR